MSKISRSSTGTKGGIGGGGAAGVKSDKAKGEKTGNAKVDIMHNSFVDAMTQVEMNFDKEELRKSLEDINKLGRDLARSPNFKLFEEYKKTISLFLKEALRRIYKVESKNGIPRYGQDQKVYLNIEKIDSTLEDMTMKFMRSQKDAIGLIKDIEDIRGLLYSIVA